MSILYRSTTWSCYRPIYDVIADGTLEVREVQVGRGGKKAGKRKRGSHFPGAWSVTLDGVGDAFLTAFARSSSFDWLLHLSPS